MMDLTEDDHNLLDEFLEFVIGLSNEGTISVLEARADIAEAVCLIANENENFRSYMRATIDAERP